jgi:endonuclease/exonuclease/phosphatase family metal-dependent hydrolase
VASAVQREREATAIRDHVASRLCHDPDALILLVGDLNDHAQSAVFRRFVQKGPVRLLHEWKLFDSGGMAWTYRHSGMRRWEQVDFAFVSSGLIGTDGWVREGSIVDGQDVELASDHRPLLLRITSACMD